MKLHTDFHDFYDHAIGYGIDEKVHYNRFTKNVDIPLRALADRPNHNKAGVLGYCGSLYPFIEISRYEKKTNVIFLTILMGKLSKNILPLVLRNIGQKKMIGPNTATISGILAKPSIQG
jgi:hypothetical protein